VLKNLWGIKTQDIELLCDIQKPIFDDDDENLLDHEDSLLNNVQIGQKRLEHKDAQPMFRATKNNIYSGGGCTFGKLEDGIGKSKNGMLRWYSKHDEDTVFKGTDHYFGKHV
jgi:hypothetical protein